MAYSLVRPDVSELVFHLFQRSVHPELFTIRVTGHLVLDEYEALICLCDAGHLVSFRYGDQTITEVLSAGGHGLPQQRRLYSQKMRGSRNESRVFDGGLRYQTCFQAETLDSELFARSHEELSLDCLKADLAYRFPPTNRLDPAPLSLVHVDAQNDGLRLYTYHTFPGCLSIVRTQTLFEP